MALRRASLRASRPTRLGTASPFIRAQNRSTGGQDCAEANSAPSWQHSPRFPAYAPYSFGGHGATKSTNSAGSRQWLLPNRVRPYHLSQSDLIRGVEHLRTPLSRGVETGKYAHGRMSGLGMPTFAVDVPRAAGAIPLLPNCVVSITLNHAVPCNTGVPRAAHTRTTDRYARPCPLSGITKP